MPQLKALNQTGGSVPEISGSVAAETIGPRFLCVWGALRYEREAELFRPGRASAELHELFIPRALELVGF
jgi:hypothetical protein